LAPNFRRRLREIARSVLPGQARPDLDYVLVGRRAALDLAFDRLIDDMSGALTRVNRADRR